MRTGIALRTGSVPGAYATTVDAVGALGLYRVIASGDGPHRLALGVRLDALLVYGAVTHLSFNHPMPLPPMRKARILPGGAAIAELDWRLAAAAAIHFGAGLEEAFGTTHLLVEDMASGDIARLRAVAEVGFRTRF